MKNLDLSITDSSLHSLTFELDISSISDQPDSDKSFYGLNLCPGNSENKKQIGNGDALRPRVSIEVKREKKISIIGKKLEGGSTCEVSDITMSQVDIELLFELPDLESGEFLI
ncbi:hypothetical protein RYX36_033832, partial [Vicia faba]